MVAHLLAPVLVGVWGALVVGLESPTLQPRGGLWVRVAYRPQSLSRHRTAALLHHQGAVGWPGMHTYGVQQA